MYANANINRTLILLFCCIVIRILYLNSTSQYPESKSVRWPIAL